MQLLKLKNFTVGRKVTDEVFTDIRGQEEVAGVVGDMVGFVSLPFLARRHMWVWFADLGRLRILTGLSCRIRMMMMMSRTRTRMGMGMGSEQPGGAWMHVPWT
jgi:hypothetical protein